MYADDLALIADTLQQMIDVVYHYSYNKINPHKSSVLVFGESTSRLSRKSVDPRGSDNKRR